MNKKTIFAFFWSIALLSLGMSCNLLAAVTGEEPENETTATLPATLVASPTSFTVAPTNTAPPGQTNTPEPANTQAGPTATTGPRCTVLQDLNFRSGPGTAYRPPVRALPANTPLIPLAFNPTGIPGGPWVQVRQVEGNEIGWVSAGEQFVSCNIDLTSLPSVNVAPPPPPPPPQTDNSTPEGSDPDNLAYEADFNPQYFVRIRAHDTSVGDQDGDGIESVSFRVWRADDDPAVDPPLYERTEQTAGYCIFGGGEPQCNPWVLEDYLYKWNPGGELVEEGAYQLTVNIVMANGDEGEWRYQIDLDLPD